MTGPRLSRDLIAMRVAKELGDGKYVNLGTGIPTLVSQFTPEGCNIVYHSESGVLNYGPLAKEGEEDINLINASGQFLAPVPGMAFFTSEDAFAMVRGGHIDITVLGAFQVSEYGDLANWIIPERGTGNIGGAMDLVAGAQRIIVAMEHTNSQNQPKVVLECTLPVTGSRCVSLIVTDVAVLEVTPSGLILKEIAPEWTPQEVQSITEPRLIIPGDLAEIKI